MGLHHGVWQDDGKALPVPELIVQQLDETFKVVGILWEKKGRLLGRMLLTKLAKEAFASTI